MDDVPLTASRLALAAVGVGGVVIVLAAALRRPPGARGWSAVVAVCVILLMFGSSALSDLGVPDETVETFSASWFVAFPLLAATFPDGRFVPRWSAWLVAGYALLLVADTIAGGAIREQPWWWVVASSQIVCLGWAGYRYRRSATTRERESVRWVLLGTVATVCCFMLIQLVDGYVGGPDPWSETKAVLAGLPLSLGLVVGAAWPRLFNIDAVFRWFIAIVGAVTLSGGAHGVVTMVFGADAVLLGVVTVGIVACPALWLGLRAGDWVVHRGRPDPAAAARMLAVALDEAPGPAAVAETIARTAAEAVRSSHAALVAAVAEDTGLFDATASASQISGRAGTASAPVTRSRSSENVPSFGGSERNPPKSATFSEAGAAAEGVGGAGTRWTDAANRPPAETFPIDFRGERLAVLHVSPRAGESALTARDRAAVTAILDHAGPALHGARALALATAAQSRLVTAREEERRRLRSDLHDDLGPTLSGLALGAAALARRATASAPGLAADAAELYRDIQAAVVQTREISYGLRPAVLDDHGLVSAVRTRVVEPLREELDIELHAEELGVLPAAVDLASLRIVQEAVANVRRHAAARHCAVWITRTSTGLELAVDDDGVGIAAAVRPGVGLRSMRERAEELGGRVRIDRAPRCGTRVRVFLPIAEETAS